MREITIIEATNEIQVKTIDENGAIHYEVYNADMKDRFISEVEGADKYVDLIQWN